MTDLHPSVVSQIAANLDMTERQCAFLLIALENQALDFTMLRDVFSDLKDTSILSVLRKLTEDCALLPVGLADAAPAAKSSFKRTVWILDPTLAEKLDAALTAAKSYHQDHFEMAASLLADRVAEARNSPINNAVASASKRQRYHSMKLPRSFPAGCAVSLVVGVGRGQRKDASRPIEISLSVRRPGSSHVQTVSKKPIWEMTDRSFRHYQMTMVANAILENLDARDLSVEEIREILNHHQVSPRWLTINDVLIEYKDEIDEQLPGMWVNSRLFELDNPYRVRVKPTTASGEKMLVLQGADYENPRFVIDTLSSWYAQWCDDKLAFRKLRLKPEEDAAA